MKKILLFLSLTAFTIAVNAQVAKRIMIEEFTQASCGPCAAQNPGFNSVLSANYSKLVSMKYQTSWPGVDPMNAQNPTEVRTRVDFYKVNGVPFGFANGEMMTGGSYEGAPDGFTQDKVDTKAAETTPISIDVTHSVNLNLDTLFVTVKIKNETASDFTGTNLVAHIAMIEKELKFPTAPGSNGELQFYNVMRKMIPNAEGTPIAGNKIAAGATVELKFAIFIPYYIYRYDQIGVVAFVQDMDSKEIHQANLSEPQALGNGGYGDIALTSSSVVPQATQGLCNRNVVPKLNFKNNGKNNITALQARIFFNGVATKDTIWSGLIAPGATKQIVWDTVIAPVGKTSMTFQLLSVNGTRDTLGFNNQVAAVSFTTIKDNVFGTIITENFESTDITKDPANAIQIEDVASHVNVVSKEYFTGVPNVPSLGAFEASEKSVMFYFWSGSMSGKKASIVWEKVDLTNLGAKTVMLFNHAYTPYTLGGEENDKVDIQASVDCGKTWVTLWSKAGKTLQTTEPKGDENQPFLPTKDEWVNDTVNLTSIAGKIVNIRIQGTSAFGDNAYIDNINFKDLSTGTSEVNILDGKVFAYPNPATDEVTIDLNIVENTNLSVVVTDVAGKVIKVLAQNEKTNTGIYQMKWFPSETGMYLIKVNSDRGSVTQKVSVIK